jgi:3-hydroxyisobutyryl-CoA hydrolase
MLRRLVSNTARFTLYKQSFPTSTLPLFMSYPFPAKKRMAQVEKHLSTTASAASSSQSGIASTGPDGKKRIGGGDAGDEPKVLSLLEGTTTTVLLNRPKALNALDDEMIHMINEALDSTPPHTHIVLRGVGRGLCSGGDVMSVVTRANSEDPVVRQQALTFFKDEFELDYKIATLNQAKVPRVLISVMDGITMGGGVGLSVNAPIRIATEKTRFAMPETGIGYFPDVGVTRHLSRLDGKVGQYLGMTGAQISGEEAYLAGLATHFVSSSTIQAILHRLSSMPANATAAQISQTLDDHSINAFDKNANTRADEILSKSCFIGDTRIALDYAFGQSSAEALYKSLQEIASGSQDSKSAQDLSRLGLTGIGEATKKWAADTLKTLDAKSPRSLKVSLMAINEARRFDTAESFRFDMRLATAFCDLGVGRDFFEGVTHTLGKDPKTGKRREGRAKWEPESLDKVSDASVRTLFFGPVAEAKKQGLSIDVPVLSNVPVEERDRAAQRQKDETTKGLGPLHWEKAHNVWALPSEAECEALREGSHPAAGNYEMTEEELVSTLLKVKGERPGLEYKVKEWMQRRSRQDK